MPGIAESNLPNVGDTWSGIDTQTGGSYTISKVGLDEYYINTNGIYHSTVGQQVCPLRYSSLES